RIFTGPDGRARRWEVTARAADGALLSQVAIDFRGDSAYAYLRRGARLDTSSAPAPRGSIPWLTYSPAIYEPAISSARRSGRRLKVGTVSFGAPAPDPLEVRVSGDSVTLINVAGENHARIDRQGRILRWDGRLSTEHYVLEPAPGMDIDAMATDFAARDRAGRGLGNLTPFDSVRATIGGADVAVHYSRPFRRGRAIFGALLPWGQVWRTGANDATAFTTSRDLVIGGVTVPAGSYTLYSIPSPTQWLLIVNRQTGQFGTEYHPEQDLARIPMTRETVAEPVEKFTISLEPGEGGAGRLALTWDDTRVWVPVRAKQP
ncbi:MAG: DUF2911 domain-containing protein, partial [Gemmatimonadetes bacterium]|nr:DUF2911 domain-containing protein [Gemmatimonadota bacterium]